MNQCDIIRIDLDGGRRFVPISRFWENSYQRHFDSVVEESTLKQPLRHVHVARIFLN